MIFDGTAKLTANTNLFTAGTGFFSISFASGAGAFTLTGNAISLTNGITNNSANTQTLNLNGITLGAAQTFNASAGNLTFTTLNNITNAGFLLTFAGASNSTVNSIISGTGGVTKTGAGTLLLTNANTFSGTTTLSAGTLRATTSVSSLGAGTLSLGGGLLELANDTGLAFNRNTTITASTQINSDRLTANVGVTHTLGTLSIGAQTLTIGSDATTTSGTAGITFGATTLSASGAVFNVNTNNALLTLGAISGNTFGFTVTGAGNTAITGIIGTTSGTVTKDGTGTLTLSAANTYTGATTISNGAVVVTGAGAISTNAVTLAASGATLNISGLTAAGSTNASLTGAAGTTVTLGAKNLTVGSANTSTTHAGTITGTGGTLTKVGTGTFTLSGANTYTGATTISNGAVRAGNADALGTTAAGTTVISGAALEVDGGVTIGAEALNLSGTGISAVGALRNISGNNTFGGLITLGAASRVNSDAGTLSLTNTGTITGPTFGLTLGGAGNISLASLIGTTTGTVTKDGAGTLTLSGANTFSGILSVQNGTLSVGTINNANADGVLGNSANAVVLGGTGTTGLLHYTGATASSTKAFSLAAGGSGNISVSNAGTALTLSGAITNSGSLVKSGAGTLILTGANTYSGTTTIGAGTLQIGSGGTTGTLGSGTVTNNTTLVFNRADDIALEAIISGTGSVVKQGAGTLTLSGENSFSGGLSILGGAVSVAQEGFLGASSNAITLNGGKILTTATVDLGPGRSVTFGAGGGTIDVATGTTATVDGVLGGTGNFSKTGAGILALDAASSGFLGATFINEGTLRLNDENVLASSDVTLASGTAIAVAFGNANIGNLGGAGDVIVSSNAIVGGLNASAVLSGIISGDGSLTKTGAGTLTLVGSNTHAGGFFLNGNGAVRAQSAGAFGSGFVTQASGSSKVIIDTTGTITNQMDIYNVSVLQSVTLTGAKTLNNATYDIAASTITTEAGDLDGFGGITKLGTGTLLLSGNNTYTGAVDVQAGLLNLNSSIGGAAATAASVSVASGATLLISQSNQVNNSAAVSLSGGTITRGSGVSEVFGNLTLSSASFLDFGTGATGTFSFGTYTPSSLLTVQNFLPGNTLTFGSDLTSSINNGSLFSFGGQFTSSWSSGSNTFTITAIPEPSTYLAVAGLLALMLWPSRRRLLKDAQSILGLRQPLRDRLAAQRES